VLASSSFGEEGVEGIIATSNRFIAWHLTIRLDSVLEAKELPTRVTDLDARLAHMDANALAHACG